MDLRNTRREDDEYKKLQLTLNGMGFYEEGMELQEMRQVLDALQMSVTESGINFFDYDMQQALRESELDFISTHDGRVLNSTMIHNSSNSPCSSPGIPPERIVTQAEVHHEMNWSPPNESLNRKRFASSNNNNNNNNNNMSIGNDIVIAELQPDNASLEPKAKRFSNICIPIQPMNNHDTEISVFEESVNNNSATNVNTLNRSFQIYSSSSYDFERRIHDSGFIKSCEIPSSSNSVTYSSVVSLNNLEKSFSELSDMHEIIGPCSTRRVNDSGVNTSMAINEYLNSSYPLENSLHMSTSSADNQNEFHDNSESSI